MNLALGFLGTTNSKNAPPYNNSKNYISLECFLSFYSFSWFRKVWFCLSSQRERFSQQIHLILTRNVELKRCQWSWNGYRTLKGYTHAKSVGCAAHTLQCLLNYWVHMFRITHLFYRRGLNALRHKDRILMAADTHPQKSVPWWVVAFQDKTSVYYSVKPLFMVLFL